MKKQKINDCSGFDFHSYDINWNHVSIDGKVDLKSIIGEIISYKRLDEISNPMEYKKVFNKVENRFLKRNLNDLIQIGIEKEFIYEDYYFENSSLKIMAEKSKKDMDDNLIYIDAECNNYQYYKNINNFIADFRDAYALIMDLSKNQYLYYLNQNEDFKENSLYFFKETIQEVNDLKNVFDNFNIFEFVTNLDEMIDILESIKDKDSFHNYLNLILENKHINLSNLLELASIYNKDDVINENKFFTLEVIWQLIDNKDFNSDCIEYIPKSLKNVDLRDTKNNDDNINSSMVKIFFIRDLNLDRYKFLEEVLNLDSLNNKLFNLRPNEDDLEFTFNDKYKKHLLKHFQLTKNIPYENFNFNENCYETLKASIDDTEMQLKSENFIGIEYKYLFNNKELFSYIYDKYESTSNKDALMVIFGNNFLGAVEDSNPVLNKINYDLTNFSDEINLGYLKKILSSVFNNHLIFSNRVDYDLYNFDYSNNSNKGLDKKLKLRIDEGSSIADYEFNSIDEFVKFSDYDTSFLLNKTLDLYKIIDNRFVIDKIKEIMVKYIDNDKINQFEKELIVNHDSIGLEIFNDIFNKSNISNDLTIKTRRKF